MNDRGPANPGRVIGLSDRAADLLGIPAAGSAQVRIEVDGERSRALGERTLGRPPEAVAIETAPRAAVAAESLNPLPGARTASPRPVAATPVAAAAAPAATTPPPDVVLPETVTTEAPAPGRVFVEAGILSRADAAQRLAAHIPGARVEAFGPRRDQRYRVRVGPFATAAQADAVLERTLAGGVSGARSWWTDMTHRKQEIARMTDRRTLLGGALVRPGWSARGSTPPPRWPSHAPPRGDAAAPRPCVRPDRRRIRRSAPSMSRRVRR